MTVMVWVASAAGALLFVAVGFIAARLTRKEEPPPLVLPSEGPSPAEVAKLRLELETAKRAKVAAEQALTGAEQSAIAAQRELEQTRQEAQRAPAIAETEQQVAKAAALERHLAEARAELEVAQGELERQQRDGRRRSAELEAVLESLTKERDTAQQQIKELERLVPGVDDDEPTNLDVSPAQFELLRDQLGKAEARERSLASELAELKAQLAQGDFDSPQRTGERKPSTLLGMKAPVEDEDELNEDFEDDLATRGRPKTLLGVMDPVKLYREAQVELDRTRAELEKARTEASFWKKHAEKLTSESTGRRSSSGSGRGRARASVGIKPTASTGRAVDKDRR